MDAQRQCWALVVEDEAVTRTVIRAILAPYFSCHEAENGWHAIECFEAGLEQRRPYDFVTIDMRMPGIDGLETLQRIRHSEKLAGCEGWARILVISGVSDDDVMRRAYESVADAYVVKPNTVDGLARAVVEQLVEMGMAPAGPAEPQ